MASLGTFSGGGLGFGIRFFLEDAFSTVAERIKDSFNQLDEKVTSVSDQVQANFGKLAAGVGLIMSAFGLVAPLWRAIEEQGKFEQTQIALETMLGSAEEMKSVVEEINALAVKTPYNLEDVEAGYKKLLAYGTPVADLKRDFTALGNITAGLGGGADTLDSFIRNLGQIRAVGVLKGKDFNDFASRGFNLVDALKKIGVEIDISKKDISAYKIPFETVIKAIHAAGEEGGQFANLMEELSSSTVGKISNMGDYVDRIFRNIGINLEDTSKSLLDLILTVLDGLSTWLGTPMGKLVTQITAGTAAVIALIVALGGLASIISALIPVALSLAAAFSELILPLLPLLGILYLLYQSVQDFNEVMDGAKPKIDGIAAGMQKLGGILRGIWAVITSMNNEGFSLPEDMVNMFEQMGILDTIINIGTWLVRIRALFMGFWEGLSTGFSFLYYSILKPLVENVLYPMLEWFINFVGGSEKAKTALEKWAIVGKYIMFGLVVVLGAIAVAIVAVAIVTISVWTVVVSVVKAVIWVLKLLWNAIYYIGVALYYVLYVAYEIFKFVFEFIWTFIDAIFIAVGAIVIAIIEFFAWMLNGLINLGKTIWDWARTTGIGWLKAFVDGIKSAWHLLTDFIMGALRKIPLLNKLFGDEPLTVNIPAEQGPAQPLAAQWWNNPQSQTIGNTAGQRSIIEGMDAATDNRAAAAANIPITVAAPYTPIAQGPIVNQIILDGEKIAENVIDRQNLNASR